MIQGSSAQIALIEKIAKDFGVCLNDFEKRNFKNIADAKRVAYYVLRLIGLSTTQIGYVMDKDHSSVINGLNTIKYHDGLTDKANSYYVWFKENYPNSIKQNTYGLRSTCIEIREKIKKCLNEGITDPSEIAFKTHCRKIVIKEHLKYILENSPKKKIPNYKNGTFKEIYV